jgi:hypothetical protein
MNEKTILFRKEALAARGLSAYGTTRIAVSLSSWIVAGFCILLTSCLALFLMLYQIDLKTKVGARGISISEAGMMVAVPMNIAETIVQSRRVEAIFTDAQGRTLRHHG